jgi:hypothetical protein
MRKLPISDKGFPVPYFAEWFDGKPDFRVVSRAKMMDAVKFNKCWVCGEPMGVHKAFVIGPMCGINRTISDPPSHPDCAAFSATHCPFLSSPLAKRNERGLPEERQWAPGHGLKRNPGVAGVWITRSFKPFRAQHGTEGILFQLGGPESIHWFARGRRATRAEVDHSIETGLPALREIADLQGGDAHHALDQFAAEFKAILDADALLNSTQVPA